MNALMKEALNTKEPSNMSVFSHPEFDNHEQLAFFCDEETGLKAIIAVHNTNLGPALGGCRMWEYASDEEALCDVLRLVQGHDLQICAGQPEAGWWQVCNHR